MKNKLSGVWKRLEDKIKSSKKPVLVKCPSCGMQVIIETDPAEKRQCSWCGAEEVPQIVDAE